MLPSLGKEPIAIIGAVATGLEAIQQAAITMPNWLHVAIGIGIIVTGAILARSQVSPAPSPPEGTTPPAAR